MARSVATTRSDRKPGSYHTPKDACTFCVIKTQDGVRHDLCKGTIGKWECKCAKEGHQ